jgi:transposase
MHADGYAGFNELYRANTVSEVACMAHIRRKFFDLAKDKGVTLAAEAVQRIAPLYAVEDEARDKPPDERAAIRQAKARRVFDELIVWLENSYRRDSNEYKNAKLVVRQVSFQLL